MSTERVSTAAAMEMLGLSRTQFLKLSAQRGWQAEYRRGYPKLYAREDIVAELQARRPGATTSEAKATPKVRPCLRCKTNFDSAWIGNRLCEPCRDFARSMRSGVGG